MSLRRREICYELIQTICSNAKVVALPIHTAIGVSFSLQRKAAKSWFCVCSTQRDSGDSSPRLSSAENEVDRDEVGLTEPKNTLSAICLHEVTGSFLDLCFCLQASSFSNLEDDCVQSQQDDCVQSQQDDVHLPSSFPHTSQESEETASYCPVGNVFCDVMFVQLSRVRQPLFVSLQVQDIPAHCSKAASRMKMTAVRGRARLLFTHHP